MSIPFYLMINRVLSKFRYLEFEASTATHSNTPCIKRQFVKPRFQITFSALCNYNGNMMTGWFCQIIQSILEFRFKIWSADNFFANIFFLTKSTKKAKILNEQNCLLFRQIWHLNDGAAEAFA